MPAVFGAAKAARGQAQTETTIVFAIISLLCALMLGACSIAAEIDARTQYKKSVADYRACLDAHPWELRPCDDKRLAMEAEERAYNNLSGAAPTNVNLQSR